MLGFLQRNLQINNAETKSNAYVALVRSNLEYCSTVWNLYRIKDVKRVEAIQRRAARYVTNRFHNRSSVSDMIQSLKWESLTSRRTKSQLTMVYKILNDHIDIPSELFTKATARTRANHNQKLQILSSRLDCYKYSFFQRIVPQWNNLPASVAEAPTLDIFRAGLNKLKIY